MVKIINPQNKPNYQMPTKSYFGRGALRLLPKIIKEEKLQNLLVVSGEHFKKSKSFNNIFKNLHNITIYQRLIKKCDFDSINKLAEFIEEKKCEGIIAVGGGTILDTAKCSSAIYINGGKIEDYLVSKTKKISKKGLFLIAIPTTAGTGSEITPWAPVWSKDKKYSMDSKYISPDIALIDPALTDSLPKKVTTETGIDALCQAIEAYWNVNSNSSSDEYALQSIKLILGNLAQAVNNPNPQLRDNMAWGSFLGGLAFSNTRTTICHSVSYPITAHWGISHGQATSITLPMFIEYTFPVLPKDKLNKILETMQVKDIKEAAKKIRKLMFDIGLKIKLSELGISKKGIELIVKEGFDPARAKNSPKIPSPNKLQEMLLGIL